MGDTHSIQEIKDRGSVIKPIYAHFSCRQPRDEEYACFASTFFANQEFKKKIGLYTSAAKLWVPGDQHINSIQSYYMALNCIYKNQVKLMSLGFNEVILVTSNSSLFNWILGRGRNDYYITYVDQVIKPFRYGAAKSIELGVGILNPVEHDKAKQYCTAKYAKNIEHVKSEIESEKSNKTKRYVIDTPEPAQMLNIFDILNRNEPDIKDKNAIIEI